MEAVMRDDRLRCCRTLMASDAVKSSEDACTSGMGTIRCATSTRITPTRLPSPISIALVTSGRTRTAIAPSTTSSGPTSHISPRSRYPRRRVRNVAGRQYAVCRPATRASASTSARRVSITPEKLKRQYNLDESRDPAVAGRTRRRTGAPLRSDRLLVCFTISPIPMRVCVRFEFRY